MKTYTCVHRGWWWYTKKIAWLISFRVGTENILDHHWQVKLFRLHFFELLVSEKSGQSNGIRLFLVERSKHLNQYPPFIAHPLSGFCWCHLAQCLMVKNNSNYPGNLCLPLLFCALCNVLNDIYYVNYFLYFVNLLDLFFPSTIAMH